MRIPIPTDWDETTYQNMLLCWPDSPQWNAILLGQVTAIQRGWFWDERTGSILDQQELSQEIIDVNTDSEGFIMGCADLVAVLESINASIQAIETAQIEIAVSANSSANSSLEMNQNIIAMSAAIAISQSWSESMALATASVELSNNVNIMIGTVSPTQPPIAIQEPLTGISDTPVLSDQYCDVAVYIVDSVIAFWENFQDLTIGVAEFTLSVLLGLVAEAVAALAIRGIPEWLMPASSTAAIASGFVGWVIDGTLKVNAQESLDILVSQRESLICLLWESAALSLDTGEIRTEINNDLSAAGATEIILQVMMPLFNPALVALMYFDAPDIAIPVSGFDCENLCGV